MVGTLILGALTVETLTAGSEYAISYRGCVWLILAGVAAAYTIFGGLKAVIYTDVIQSVLLLVGARHRSRCSPSGIRKVGGISGLLERQPEKFHVFFPADHPELPWSGVLSGLMVLHLYYWGTNQFIVQRTLGAKTGWDARTGTIMAGFFKLLIPFMCIVPGMAAALILAIDPETQSDTAFAGLTRTLLPAGYGLVGLVMAGLIGGILVNNRLDDELYGDAVHFRHLPESISIPDATEMRLIWVGRLAMMSDGLAWRLGCRCYFGQARGGIFNTYGGLQRLPGTGRDRGLRGRHFAAAGHPHRGICVHSGRTNLVGCLRVGCLERVRAQAAGFSSGGIGDRGVLLDRDGVSLLTQRERDSEREHYTWRRFTR